MKFANPFMNYYFIQFNILSYGRCVGQSSTVIALWKWQWFDYDNIRNTIDNSEHFKEELRKNGLNVDDQNAQFLCDLTKITRL